MTTKANSHFVDCDKGTGTSGVDSWNSGVAILSYPLLRTTVSDTVEPDCSHDIAVNNLTDLQNMQNNRAGHYYLTANIDATETSTWNAGKGFVPIGTRTFIERFTGTFDGCDYTINNLYIHSPIDGNASLFGFIDGATIKNLILKNVDIFCPSNDNRYAAALFADSDVATGYWNIYNCHSSGKVENANDWLCMTGGLIGWASGIYPYTPNACVIANCSSSCEVIMSGGGYEVGGFMGDAVDCDVINCYSTGSVSVPYESSGFATEGGGFVGYAAYAVFTNCYSTAPVDAYGQGVEFGGFIGLDDGDNTFSYCYATGDVSVDVSGFDYTSIEAGGFVGATSNRSNIQKCYATGNITIVADYQGETPYLDIYGVGGFTGLINGSEYFKDCYAWGNITINEYINYIDGAGGFVGSLYGYDCNVINCYSIGSINRANNPTSEYVGGFNGSLGYNVSPTVVDSCYWDMETSGFTESLAATGETTSEMQTKSTFIGWDFDTIWYMPSNGSNLQTRTTAYPQDYSHLNGETVQVLGDGNYLGTEIVANGVITLDDLTTVNHVGLQFDSKVQPMKIEGEVNVKRISKLIPVVYESVGGEYGEDLTTLYSMSLSNNDIMDTDSALYTGHIELPFNGVYDRSGDIWIKQDKPLPMNLIGIGVNLSQEEI